MLKLPAVSVALLVIATNSASACVGYDGPSDTFTSTCQEEVYVEYRTVGGGCYTTNRGAFSLKPNESWTDLRLSESCGSTGNWRVDWAWCDHQEWKNGTCKPRF